MTPTFRGFGVSTKPGAIQSLALRGFPIPSPAAVGWIRDQFRHSVRSFCDLNQIPMVVFRKGDREIATISRIWPGWSAPGPAGVAAVRWAQEFQRLATCMTTPGRA